MTTQFRAGRYVKQPNHYSAFMPEPLPPLPPIDIDGAMQTMLSKADRALGRLDGSIQTLPDPDMFVFMYVRKEAVLSSQIEGTQSSLNDLLEAEAAIHDADRPSDVSEVLNYVRAMNYGLQRLAELPISVRLIREIHERLMHGVRGNHANPGELRTSQNWIGPGGSTLNDAIFVPPPPHEVGRLLSDLEKFVHTESDIRVTYTGTDDGLRRKGLSCASDDAAISQVSHPFHDFGYLQVRAVQVLTYKTDCFT